MPPRSVIFWPVPMGGFIRNRFLMSDCSITGYYPVWTRKPDDFTRELLKKIVKHWLKNSIITFGGTRPFPNCCCLNFRKLFARPRSAKHDWQKRRWLARWNAIAWRMG